MSVLRIKAYHGVSSIKNALEYAADTQKTNLKEMDDSRLQESYTSDSVSAVERAITYSSNPNKTNVGIDGDMDILVSGHHCKPDIAADQFHDTMDLYYMNGHNERLDVTKSKRLLRAKLDASGNPIVDENGNMIHDDNSPVYHDENGKCVYQNVEKIKEARTAYMWVQSFPPKSVIGYDIDPRLVHQIGLEFCEKLEHYQATVSTHVNTNHVHNHIIMCAYDETGSFKYKDNMETLAQMRDISDDLSRKYGLPIILEPESDRGISWFEWKRKKEGKSWKEVMRQDIKNAIVLSNSYNDFLEVMKQSGYTCRETENHITYCMPDSEYRCRDNKLGNEFTKTEIMKYFEKEMEMNRPNLHSIKDPALLSHKQKKPVRIYVSRYTLKGRKRSDLEILFLVAIKIIKLFADKFSTPQPEKIKTENPIFKASSWKLSQMEDCLYMVQQLGIKDKAELEGLLNQKGTTLSHKKKELADLKHNMDEVYKIKNLFDELQDLQPAILNLGVSKEMLFTYDFSNKEVKSNKARLSPMTSKQRRDLVIALENQYLYKPARKFDDISYSEAKKAIDFLKGKSNVKPGCIVDLEEHDNIRLELKFEKILESRINSMKNKYSDKPLSDWQEKKITEIINGTDKSVDVAKLNEFADVEIDTSKLSYYDGIRFINYLTKENPFNDVLADTMSRDKLSMLLTKNNASINRNIEYITLSEIKEIEKYFASGKNLKEPDLLKAPESVNESFKAKVKQLIAIRNESLTIPVDVMSGYDLKKLESYLLFKNSVPECLLQGYAKENERLDLLFENSLLDYSSEEQMTIATYRNVLNELATIGISLDDIAEEMVYVDNNISDYNELVKEVKSLSDEYKDLARLKYNIGFAENKKFTYGPLYEETPQEPEIISDNKDLPEEDRNEMKEQEEKEEKKEKDRAFFNTVDKYFNMINSDIDR